MGDPFVDSFFESGNIEKAFKSSRTHFDLFMNVDTNTRGHQQWFYFRVRGMAPGVTYTFSIRNFTKTGSLYRKGMKVQVKEGRDGEWGVLECETSYLRT